MILFYLSDSNFWPIFAHLVPLFEGTSCLCSRRRASSRDRKILYRDRKNPPESPRRDPRWSIGYDLVQWGGGESIVKQRRRIVKLLTVTLVLWRTLQAILWSMQFSFFFLQNFLDFLALAEMPIKKLLTRGFEPVESFCLESTILPGKTVRISSIVHRQTVSEHATTLHGQTWDRRRHKNCFNIQRTDMRCFL